MTLKKIISGGQTGADRAGLNAAIKLNIPHGGYCPVGRVALDGRIPDHYNLTEHGKGYRPRTRKNVQTADGTVIFVGDRLTGGSLVTRNFASQYSKPCAVIYLSRLDNAEAAVVVRDFIDFHGLRVLNVAGKRADKVADIENRVEKILLVALTARRPMSEVI
jgi:hypothetical protein